MARSGWRRSSAAGLAALALLAPAPAHAAIDFAPCRGATLDGLECGTVTVPRDHSGAVEGTIPIAVYRAPARGTARGTLLALPGGPGDAGRASFPRHLAAFDAARATHDLVFIDPRGTGASAPLGCVDAPTCATALGPASALYTSRDTAEDLEAVRAALGVEQLALYGISYGTWYAQTYARRHPDRVSALVLDALVPPSAHQDPFSVAFFRGLPGAVRSICEDGACRGITGDAWTSARDLLRQALRRPLPARLTDAQGRRRSAPIDGISAALAAATADVNPALRIELPAAVAAARRGDRDPLARLVAGGLLTAPDDPAAFNTGVNAATQCEETGLPWERSAPFEERLPEARRRLAQIPPSTFAPLTGDQALLASIAPVCERWPAAPESPLVTGPLPPVPTLVLAGDADMRTPLAPARGFAAETRARLLVVENTGHGALYEDPSRCASTAVASLLGGRAIAGCKRSGLRPRPAFPQRLADLPGRDRAAEAASAAVLTATDALNAVALRVDALRHRVPSVRLGGLRGGRVRGGLGRVTLERAVLVPGLAVSGTAFADGRHDLRLSGAVTGTLRVRGRRVTGRIDGRPLRLTLDLRAVGAAGVRVERVA